MDLNNRTSPSTGPLSPEELLEWRFYPLIGTCSRVCIYISVTCWWKSIIPRPENSLSLLEYQLALLIVLVH